MKRRIAAIVVTYNRKELLKENIESLLAQTCKSCLDIVIVDNNSDDGTKEYIAPYIEREDVIYLNTGANLGGAGGFQFGIRYAAENGYSHIWLMDDDCIPRPDALKELIKWDRKLKGNYGFLSSKVIWKDGSICNMNGQGIGIRKRVVDYDKPITKIITATFVSFFFPASVVFEIGLPIKEFFIWCDDIEYSRRISKKHPCYLISSSVAEHKCATNVGSNIALDTPERIERYNYSYRNEVYYYRHQGVLWQFYFIMRLTKHVLKILFLADSLKMKRLKVMFGATLRGIKFKPKVEYVKKR